MSFLCLPSQTIHCISFAYKKSDPKALYELLLSIKKPGQTIVLKEEASEALSYCLEHTTTDDPVLAAGSFYLAGVLKEALCH